MSRTIPSVYVVGVIDGPVKIGMSQKVSKRMKQLEKSQEHVIVHYGEFPTWRANVAERYAHWILRDKSRGYEWFNATPDEACAAVRQAVEAAEKGMPMLPTLDKHGAPIRFAENMYLKFVPGTMARIKAIKPEDQNQTDFLRELVEAELARRELASAGLF